MKSKMISLGIISFCVLNATYADVPPSYPTAPTAPAAAPQAPDNGYPVAPAYRAHAQAAPAVTPTAPDRRHHEEREHHRDRISISFGGPGPVIAMEPEPVAPPAYADVDYRHHHHGAPHWVGVSSGEPLPHFAVVGGHEHRRPIFVCRANYNGGVHPGRVLGDICDLGWGGYEVPVHQYEVLSSKFMLSWVPAGYGSVPPGALDGGYENGHPLFVCQARYRGGVYPGKVVGQGCNISWGGREVNLPNYNVLVG